MKAQGSELYAIDPLDDSILVIDCITDMNIAGTTIEQNDVTCLQETVRRFEPGLGTPGTATFGIYTDLKFASHMRLLQLKNEQTSLKWAVGFSDGTGIPPTVGSDGEFDLPDTRSWLTFEGFMNEFPFALAQNTPVQSQISIQVSGDLTPVPKTAS